MGFDDILEWFIDLGESINDFFINIGEWIAGLFGFLEVLEGDGASPLSHWAYWFSLILYVVGTWYLPHAWHMAELSLRDKILGTVIFTVIDYLIIKKFMD